MADVNGYKLWYVGSNSRYSGVGILVSNKILKHVIEVKRCKKRMMLVRLVVGEVTSIVNAYWAQIGLEKEEKCEFWDNLAHLMRTIPRNEKVFFSGDFNGHIGKEPDDFNLVQGGLALVQRMRVENTFLSLPWPMIC